MAHWVWIAEDIFTHSGLANSSLLKVTEVGSLGITGDGTKCFLLFANFAKEKLCVVGKGEEERIILIASY